MKSDKSALIYERLRIICQKCESLRSNEIFFLLQRNLQAAMNAANTDQQRPVIITIIGGTGVGKSFIFSTLCSTPDISPSSGSVRGFTRKLFISATREDEPLLPFANDDAQFLPGLLPGAVLIDTPDLDTINNNNARLARETIDISDIIICVTTPDKRSNISIHQNIVEWASRKRWFFVINKTDTAPDVSVEKLQSDLSERLQALGFDVDPAALFAFSARSEDSTEFKRFKDTVFSQRTVAQSHILREESDVRRILHALNAEKSADHILKTYHELTSFRTSLNERITEQHKLVTSSPAITGLATDAIRSSLYRELAGNSSLFLYPYFALINWLSPGVTPEAAQKAVESAIAANFKLCDCYTDERRFLEDRHLPAELPMVNAFASQHSENGEVFLQIIEEAQKKSETRLMRFYIFAGNLLPMLVLLQALYHSIVSWANGVWLPSDFFVHAIFLIVVATLPGYVLVAKALTRLSGNFALRSPQQVSELKLLNANINAIDKILQETSLLSNAAETQLTELKIRLPKSSYGISARN